MTTRHEDSSTKLRATRRCDLIAEIVGVAILGLACGPPQSERLAIWDVCDESSVERIEHGPWQAILDGYVISVPAVPNVVDYAALAGNPGDVAILTDYLDYLQSVDPRQYACAEQMAYWINLYNALTVKVVLDAYPVNSIKKIHRGVVPLTGPWSDMHGRVAGQDLTLDQIEHGILRPIWQDERIHYAVNCAAYGCPQLLETAFTAENSEALLEAGARAYVNSPQGVRVVNDGLVIISSIYDWYAVDFGGTEEAVLQHLVKYADTELAAFLTNFEGVIEYAYDWRLNQAEH